VLFLQGAVAASDDAPVDASSWHYQLYLDAGYAGSDNEPANRDWRSKSTTNKLDGVELFLGMANVRREASAESRWGFEFGLQAGIDSEGLVTSTPPPADEPIGNADTWRYLYRANASYLFDAGRGVRLTGGLINSYVGYESYLAIDNPSYTRGYITDTVPYFMIGFETAWDVSEKVDLSFYLVSGWNYLTRPNSVPSTGGQVVWQITPRATFTQNLYYGPDQSETSPEYWRLFSDTNFEWKADRWLVAGAIDLGTEKQAHLHGEPRHQWSSGAVWVRWWFAGGWSVGFRPELYRDDDGRATGAAQRIQAYTGTVKYEFTPGRHRLVGVFELRYDRSTGDQGGYFQGSDNLLVPTQSLALLGLLWSFEH
jgi:hypothetical protein